MEGEKQPQRDSISRKSSSPVNADYTKAHQIAADRDRVKRLEHDEHWDDDHMHSK